MTPENFSEDHTPCMPAECSECPNNNHDRSLNRGDETHPAEAIISPKAEMPLTTDLNYPDGVCESECCAECDYNSHGKNSEPYYEESNRGRRTLKLEYWTRSAECKERKWDHLDELDANANGISREDHIYSTTLKGRTSFLEPNMFPYETPAGIEHWTLWSLNEMDHYDVQDYVEQWISTNAPGVLAWNYDDNPERSIDIFHVHVYFQVSEKDSVLQGRNVEDLIH